MLFKKVFDDKTWLAIQERLNKVCRCGLDGVKHIFCGKVYCGVCNGILHKNSSITNKDSEKIEYLVCRDKKIIGLMFMVKSGTFSLEPLKKPNEWLFIMI